MVKTTLTGTLLEPAERQCPCWCVGGANTVKLWESAIRMVCWCVSAGLRAESGPGQGYIQLLVVLDQGCVSVVEHQLSQRRVQVVGLSKAEPCGCPVDHTVLHIPVHTARDKTENNNYNMDVFRVVCIPKSNTGKVRSLICTAKYKNIFSYYGYIYRYSYVSNR